jgi:hypothetical protein
MTIINFEGKIIMAKDIPETECISCEKEFLPYQSGNKLEKETCKTCGEKVKSKFEKIFEI